MFELVYKLLKCVFYGIPCVVLMIIISVWFRIITFLLHTSHIFIPTLPNSLLWVKYYYNKVPFIRGE